MKYFYFLKFFLFIYFIVYYIFTCVGTTVVEYNAVESVKLPAQWFSNSTVLGPRDSIEAPLGIVESENQCSGG